jgi:ADP-ribosyl-[dinitrogen reductase] hydrolase
MSGFAIATLALPGGGAIGFARCPVEEDLDAMRAWAPDAVLTLLEHGPRADAVGRLAALLGVPWHHLPIIDYATPDAGFEAAWQATGATLRGKLRQGGRLLLHCAGGLGRSGTIAARLLVELNEAAPEAAILAVRAARPGAIETPAQAAHVRAARPARVG